jgi:hypothetical protein
VPFDQAQQLITEISETFKVSVSVPESPFTFTFYADGTPQPIFLGKSQSRHDANALQSEIPAAPVDHGDCPDDASNQVRRSFDDFKTRCLDAIAAGKAKGGKSGRNKYKEEDRLLAIKDWYSQLRRGQRYLGLRVQSGSVLQPDPALSWIEQEQFRKDQLKKAHLVLDPLNIDQPAPFPFESQPVIISIDIESYERAHDIIMEVGISTLDTLDLVGIPPGPKGKNWLDQIRSRHFRIKGRERYVNKDFCVGYPNAFQFGESEWVDLTEAADAMDGCFEWPFSVQFRHESLEDSWADGGKPSTETKSAYKELSTKFEDASICPTDTEQEIASRAAVDSVLNGIGDEAAIQRAIDLAKANKPSTETLQQGPKERKIVLVGHDIRADLEYLKSLGSKIFSPSRGTYPMPAMSLMTDGERFADIVAAIIDCMDTAPLYRVLKSETQTRKLASIMSDLGLPCQFPHNGGNDARYTLEAWVAMLIQARLAGDDEQKQEDERAQKYAEQAKQADTWNEGSDWATQPDADPSQENTPGIKEKDNLDAFESALLSSSPETAPPREKDEGIAALAQKLRLEPDA